MSNKDCQADIAQMVIALIGAREAGLDFERHNYSAALPWLVVAILTLGFVLIAAAKRGRK